VGPGIFGAQVQSQLFCVIMPVVKNKVKNVACDLAGKSKIILSRHLKKSKNFFLKKYQRFFTFFYSKNVFVYVLGF
jgi:hypothetical protein